MSGIPALDRARLIVAMVEQGDPADVAAILLPMVRESPEDAVSIIIALVAMSDQERVLKDAHAAYTRGDREPIIVELEREYQRARKGRARDYRAAQARRQAEREGAA